MHIWRLSNIMYIHIPMLKFAELYWVSKTPTDKSTTVDVWCALEATQWTLIWYHYMGLLPDAWNYGLRMPRNAGNVFPVTVG